eukprot:3545311-Prymnesium_polylepis.1
MSRMTYTSHGGGAALGGGSGPLRPAPAQKARGDPHPEKCLHMILPTVKSGGIGEGESPPLRGTDFLVNGQCARSSPVHSE